MAVLRPTYSHPHWPLSHRESRALSCNHAFYFDRMHTFAKSSPPPWLARNFISRRSAYSTRKRAFRLDRMRTSKIACAAGLPIQPLGSQPQNGTTRFASTECTLLHKVSHQAASPETSCRTAWQTSCENRRAASTECTFLKRVKRQANSILRFPTESREL